MRLFSLALLLTLSVPAAAQSAALASPAAPVLRSAGRYGMERYLNIRSASRPSYAPNTDDIAYLTAVTEVNQVWKHPARGGWPEQLTFFNDRVLDVEWSPRGDLILLTKDQGGDERGQLYVMDPEGESIEALTSNPKVIHQFGGFSRDGAWICYSSNERSERLFDVYVMELATRKARRIYAGDENFYARSFSPDGRYVLAERERSSYDNDLFLIDTQSDSIVHLTPHTGDAVYRDVAWLPDGSGFYLASNQDRDKFNLAFFDLRRKSLAYIEDSPQDLDDATGIAIDRSGNFLFYAWDQAGASSVRIRNLKTNQVQIFRGLPSGVVGQGSFNGDGTKVAFSYSSATINGDVWVMDLKQDRASQVTHSTRAGIPSSSFVAPETVAYASFDGTQIPAFLYLPKGAEKHSKLPAIVSIHGGPESQERASFNAIYQYFLNRGYAVLAPNIRGSSGFGKQYMHMDDYRKRPDAIKDAAWAADYLKSTGYIDAKKIAVMGGSYGGFMTLAQATMFPDRWAAAVDIVGISNWFTFFKNTGAWRRSHRANEYGDPEKDPEFMKSISPINFVKNIRAPLFVIAGANDPRVPKGEADQMVEQVRARGVPVEYISFPDEGHGMAKRANRIRGYTAIADFLDKYLRNAP
ncbi:MAG TPA: S9 family peptidase [Terriglobales bacterium]|nr:S9 family peptidase [Terriglobales bacterium]